MVSFWTSVPVESIKWDATWTRRPLFFTAAQGNGLAGYYWHLAAGLCHCLRSCSLLCSYRWLRSASWYVYISRHLWLCMWRVLNCVQQTVMLKWGVCVTQMSQIPAFVSRCHSTWLHSLYSDSSLTGDLSLSVSRLWVCWWCVLGSGPHLSRTTTFEQSFSHISV